MDNMDNTLNNEIIDHSFISFKKIANFKNTKDEPIGIFDFIGTVKLHGTHGDIVHFNDGHLNIQSRNRILSVDDDNMGFATFITQNNNYISSLFDKVIDIYGIPYKHIMLSGEWCGGNIQKNVALTKLPRMFVIFAVYIDNTYLDMELFRNVYNESANIYNIYQFPTYNITIDFNDTTDAETLLTHYTNEIEKECPVGKYFGFSGIGEGIVWISKNSFKNTIIFKTKGDLFTIVLPRKKTNITTDNMDAALDDFVKDHITENRLNQGIEYLQEFNLEISKLNTNIFRQWIENDITTEEKNTIDNFELTPEQSKMLKKKINNYAASWFVKYNKETKG